MKLFETDKKIASGVNKSAHGTPAHAKRLGECSEITRQEAVSHEFRTALRQARKATKMSRTHPTTAISEKGAIISGHEFGRADPERLDHLQIQQSVWV